MKNLEVKFSLSELEFRCKNPVFDMGKELGSKNSMVAFFICNPPLLHGRSYVKVGKCSRDRTVDLENGCDRTRE